MKKISVMQRIFGIALALFLTGAFIPAAGFAAGFGPGNLVVFRAGDGISTLSAHAAAVFLDEYSATSGTLVQTIALPTAASGSNRPLTVAGNESSEGSLRLSVDGRYLTLTGYAAVPGTASVAGTTSAAINRVVGRVDLSGVVDTSTVLNSAFSGANIRGAVTVDGTRFWTVGSKSGVQYVAFGSSGASTQINSAAPTDLRVTGIINSQLYVSSSSGTFKGVGTVGSGLTTTGGQTPALLAGFPTSGSHSPYGFFFADANTVYVADDGTAANGGGIQKWTLNAGTWSLAKILNLTTPAGFRGLTGYINGPNVVLFATTDEASANRLVRVTDDGSAAPAFTTLATAATKKVFRGVAIPPVTLSVVTAGTGSGSISGVANPYNVGSVATISANPATGSSFSAWSGCSTSTSPTINVAMDAAKSCTAIFTLNQYTQTFTTDGHGTLSGSTTQNVDYGGSASAVTAIPHGGYSFLNWTGDNGFIPSYANPLTVNNVSASQTITANFIAQINGVCGSANGQTLISAPATSLCSAGNASSVGGSGPWSWTCAGLYGGSTVSCSANIQMYPLTVTISGTGSGSVAANTGSIIWSVVTGTATYNYNTNVILSATPAAGSVFTGWSGACTGMDACALTMDAARNVTALFMLNPVPRTGQIVSYAEGDDGAFLAGALWPDQRFTAVSSGTGAVVTDNLTGLIWTQDGAPTVEACISGSSTSQPDARMKWQAALDYVACLNSTGYLGYDDWRLPNVNELRSLVSSRQGDQAAWLNEQGFINTQSSYYWSSSTYASNASNAWVVDFSFGDVYHGDKTYAYYVRCVRGGQPWSYDNSIVSPPKTGQTASYAAGDDGAIQAGSAWPATRFMENGDQAVTDSLSGLIWTQDGNAPGPSACGPATSKTWQGALAYAACLNTNNYLGHNDWRLPNVNELQSLVNNGQGDQAAWLNAQGFINTQSSYWSSSAYAGHAGNAWIVYFTDGSIGHDGKTFPYSVRCVRGGQIGILVDLVISKSGTGRGIASADTGALSWTGSSGVASYPTGLVVTLTAGADSCSDFVGWSGAGCSGTGACQVTMSQARNVTATFTWNSNLPSEPLNVAATPAVKSAVVTFNAPVQTGNTPIGGYMIYANGALAKATALGSLSSAMTYSVTGLSNNTAYSFTVAAVNAQGTGLVSGTSNTVMPHDVPGMPDVSAATVEPGYKTATVTFNAPATDGGGAITGYTVLSNPAGGVDNDAGSTVRTHHMTGLTNFVKYTFTVTATNDIGTGKASARTASVIPFLAVSTVSVNPDPAPDTKKARLTNNNTPTWTWASAPDGGSGTFQFVLSNTKTGVTTTTIASTTSFTPSTALADGVYKLSVKEQGTALDWSSEGVSHTITIDATPPITAITDVAIKTSVTDTTRIGTATFKFTTEKTKGTTLSCSIDGGASWETLCKSPKAYSDLDPGMHTFSVKATDAAGNDTFAPAQFTFIVN